MIAVFTGVVLGAVTLLLTLRLGVLAIVLPICAIAVVRRRGLAVGGGLLLAFGLGFVWTIAAANERCAEFNRQPNAGCQTFGTEEQFILAGSVAILGTVLAALALVRERR